MIHSHVSFPEGIPLKKRPHLPWVPVEPAPREASRAVKDPGDESSRQEGERMGSWAMGDVTSKSEDACMYVCIYIYIIYIICIYIIIFYHRRSLPSKILKRLRISPKNIIFRFSDEEILDVQKWGKFTKDWEIINQKWRFRGSSSHVILHSSRLESHFGESSRHGEDFKQTWSGDDNQQRWGFHQ